MNDLVIAFDVGATNTRARISATPGARPDPVVPSDISTRTGSASELHDVISEVVAAANRHGKVVSAVVAVAGPVDAEQSRITNWAADSVISVAELERAGLPTGRTRLVNDVVAGAWGALARLDGGPGLAPPVPLNEAAGSARLGEGSLVYVAPGTGLGAAALVRHGLGSARASAVGCEFQHTQAPRFEGEIAAVVDALTVTLGHPPSWEDMVSGRGLPRILTALSSLDLAETSDRVTGSNPDAAAIATAALKGDDPPAVAAINIYYRVLGHFLQTLALACLPCAAVVIGGDSTSRNLELLRRSGLTDGFAQHDRLGPLLAKVPLYAVGGEVNLEGGVWLALHG